MSNVETYVPSFNVRAETKDGAQGRVMEGFLEEEDIHGMYSSQGRQAPDQRMCLRRTQTLS